MSSPISAAPLSEGRATARPRGLFGALLGVPLAGKVAGANVLLLMGVGIACRLATARADNGAAMAMLVIAAAISIATNVALVRLALHPVHEIERTAERVSGGDLTARVAPSPLADRDVARVGDTLNELLARLLEERARVRRLAGASIRAADGERARVARLLHDGAAQTLAALSWQAASAARGVTDPELAEQLTALRDLAVEALEEVRRLSHTVHPRILDDLGLAPAVVQLAREVEHNGDVPVAVRTSGDMARLGRATAAALYRVAEEAVTNAVCHSRTGEVRVLLAVDGERARVEVSDDGPGFDVAEAERRRPGAGLAMMRDRVALLGGTVRVESAPARGTTVIADLPTNSTMDLTA